MLVDFRLLVYISLDPNQIVLHIWDIARVGVFLQKIVFEKELTQYTSINYGNYLSYFQVNNFI